MWVFFFSQVLTVFSLWASLDNINAQKPWEGEQGLTSSLNEKNSLASAEPGKLRFHLPAVSKARSMTGTFPFHVRLGPKPISV